MGSLIHILHLEDDPMDGELIEAKLKEADLPCRITRVETQDEFEQALGREALDIILADFRLPMYNGLSALRMVMERRPEIPFIFVSGTIGEEAAIEALTKGATDYVLKQGLNRLGPAVKRALREARNRCERKQAERALAESETKMRSILNSVDEGFVVLDRGYRILSANKAFCNLTGLDEDQAVADMLGGSVGALRLQNFRALACWRRAGLDDLAEAFLRDGLSKHHAVMLHTDFGKTDVDFFGREKDEQIRKADCRLTCASRAAAFCRRCESMGCAVLISYCLVICALVFLGQKSYDC